MSKFYFTWLPKKSRLPKVFQFIIKPLYRQAHDIEIRAHNIRHANVTYPLLRTVRAGFVHRFILRDVILYLIIIKGCKVTSDCATKPALFLLVVIVTPVNT